MADVTSNGVRLHVQRISAPTGGADAGPRPVVVFLHGLVMDNLSSWYFSVATPTSRVADVVLYDLRGHGLSERPATGYTVDDMVADLLGVLDALAITAPVHLVGNSFGGLVALGFARAHPGRTAGVVLVDGHLGDHGFGAAMAATLRLEGEARDQRIADSFKHWLGRHSARKRTRLADVASAIVGGTSLVDDVAATPPVSAADLAAIRAPVLAIYGEASDLRASAEALLGDRPGVELVIVPGASHSVLWEATDLVKARVAAFVTAPAAGQAA